MVAELLLEAAGLMLIGMVTVFTFLCLLVFLLQVMSNTIQRYFPVKVSEKSNKVASSTHAGVSPTVIAAISAAVHQYRQKQ